MKHSRLHAYHVKLGATFETVTDWQVPAHYGDMLGEYQAVRDAVGLADLSHRGKVRVTGENRVKWLQSVISNDILTLHPGQGRYSSLLTHKGKMLTYFRCYVQTDAVMLEDVGDLGDTTYRALRRFLLYGTKAKMEDCAETWGILLVCGPSAARVVKAAFGTDVDDLKPVDFVAAGIGGQTALMIRTEETAQKDYAILIPAEGLATAWERVIETGRQHGIKPVGRQALEALRIEAGIPQAGTELNEDIVPPEANLEGKAFSLTKGCYPGQEVVARMDTYGNIRRHLVGLVVKDSALPRKGAKLFSGDREVGWISSAVTSPKLRHNIALGFPLRDFSKPGTELSVDIEGSRVAATVRALPF